MKIGIFGGSFDPVHKGHISLANKSLKQLKLDYLFFVPAYSVPYKSKKLTAAFHRKKMLRLAIKGRSKLLISDFELNLKKKTYTYQTLEHFRKKYRRADVYLIIGSDSVLDFKNWKKYKNILSNSKVVFAERNGYKAKNKKGFIKLQGNIADISSTDIRKQLRKGLSIKGLVPLPVELYINKNGLYKRD